MTFQRISFGSNLFTTASFFFFPLGPWSDSVCSRGLRIRQAWNSFPPPGCARENFHDYRSHKKPSFIFWLVRSTPADKKIIVYAHVDSRYYHMKERCILIMSMDIVGEDACCDKTHFRASRDQSYYSAWENLVPTRGQSAKWREKLPSSVPTRGRVPQHAWELPLLCRSRYILIHHGRPRLTPAIASLSLSRNRGIPGDTSFICSNLEF